MENILKIVSEATEVPANDILSRKRDGRTSEARCIFMYFAHSYGESNTCIARFIGRSQGNVSILLKRINAQVCIYKSLNDKIKQITKIASRNE